MCSGHLFLNNILNLKSFGQIHYYVLRTIKSMNSDFFSHYITNILLKRSMCLNKFIRATAAMTIVSARIVFHRQIRADAECQFLIHFKRNSSPAIGKAIVKIMGHRLYHISRNDISQNSYNIT